jgi:DNA primase small subunit
MPHSITPEAMSSPRPVKDEPVEEDNGIPSGTAPVQDGDVDMAEAGDVKKEVKQLEDLFDDDDSDDEFPSSAPVQPSSQIAPASPTYVSLDIIVDLILIDGLET